MATTVTVDHDSGVAAGAPASLPEADPVTLVAVSHLEDEGGGWAAPLAAAAPAPQVVEPITLEQAKAHLRVVVPDDDAYITGLILAARQMAEGRLNRTLVQRRRRARFDNWNGVLRIPKPPVLTIDAVEYLDSSGLEAAILPSNYEMQDEEDSPYMHLWVDYPYPALYRHQGSIKVTYTAGYPVGEVPAPIVQWMLLAIGTMYENRAAEVVGATVAALPDDFMKWLLQPYRVYE